MAIIDVIQFKGIANRDWLVYRYPRNNFVCGSQLIVGEGQMAVFVKGGQALDCFSPGTYTLHTNNIPILTALVNLPFGGDTPFSAEIYFINNTAKLDILWGTTDPISLIDPKYGVRLRVRAFGQFASRITEHRVFLTELIGAMGDGQIVKYDLVISYFKGVIVTKVKTTIADIIINQKISVLEIIPLLEEVSRAVNQRLTEEFERYGINIINFYINSINFPDEDFAMINRILGEKAAFEIIGDSRYRVKRSFDVLETAADNEGGGGLAAAGIGIGLGAGAAATAGHLLAGSIGGAVHPPGAKTCRCGVVNAVEAKFCSDCGEKLADEKISCYSCQSLVDSKVKFCPHCGCSMAKKLCAGCQAENLPGTKFCAACGAKLEEE